MRASDMHVLRLSQLLTGSRLNLIPGSVVVISFGAISEGLEPAMGGDALLRLAENHRPQHGLV